MELFNGSLVDYLPVFNDLPLQEHIACIGEVMAVGEGHDTPVDFYILHIEVLIYFLQLMHLRLRGAIGIHQPVVHVGPVDMVDDVPVLLPVLILRAEALIHPVPGEAALKAVELIIQVPVAAEVTQPVAHGVRILADDDGARGVAVEQKRQLIGGGVHVGDEVISVDPLRGGGVFGFVMYGPCLRVDRLHGLIGRIEVLSPAGLVAHGPEDDGGVVAVSQHHVDVAFHDGLLPLIALADEVTGTPQAVTLHVALVHHVEAVCIAEVVPLRRVGVVTGPDSIDVVLFHQDNIADHRLTRDSASAVHVELMPVDTFDGDRLSVHQEERISDLYMAKAAVHHECLNGLAARRE